MPALPSSSTPRSTGLRDPKLVRTLDRLHRAAASDPWVFLRAAPSVLRAMARRRGFEEAMIPHLKDAYIPVNRAQGELLYLLARAIGAKQIVEYGTSFGVSTLYLAAAVRDQGEGRVVGSEMEAAKRAAALANLEEAGLASWAEVRGGDARASLAAIEGPIDLLFLDGWSALYLPMLKLLEPKLRKGALVVADDIKLFRKSLAGYLDHVRANENGYTSVELPIGDGLEISMWMGRDEG